MSWCQFKKHLKRPVKHHFCWPSDNRMKLYNHPVNNHLHQTRSNSLKQINYKVNLKTLDSQSNCKPHFLARFFNFLTRFGQLKKGANFNVETNTADDTTVRTVKAVLHDELSVCSCQANSSSYVNQPSFSSNNSAVMGGLSLSGGGVKQASAVTNFNDYSRSNHQRPTARIGCNDCHYCRHQLKQMALSGDKSRRYIAASVSGNAHSENTASTMSTASNSNSAASKSSISTIAATAVYSVFCVCCVRGKKAKRRRLKRNRKITRKCCIKYHRPPNCMNSSYFDSVQQSNESANDVNSTAINSHTLNSQIEQHYQLELSPHQPNCPAAGKDAKLYTSANKYTLKHRQQEYTASIVGKTNDLFLTRGNGTTVGIGLGNFNGKIKMNSASNNACHLASSLEQATKKQSTEFCLKRNLINKCKERSFSSTMFLINSEKGDRRERGEPYEACDKATGAKSDPYELMRNDRASKDENFNNLNSELSALADFGRQMNRESKSDYLIKLINNPVDAQNDGREAARTRDEINERLDASKENNAKVNSVTLIIDEVGYDDRELHGQRNGDRV